MEARFWAREWRRPQAVMWERNGQVEEVALYVRALAVAQEPEASTASRTLVRQMQEALGVSLPGLARNRWRIAARTDAAVAPRRAAGQSTRERFRVVTPDDVA
jgi:hypothetical protein